MLKTFSLFNFFKYFDMKMTGFGFLSNFCRQHHRPNKTSNANYPFYERIVRCKITQTYRSVCTPPIKEKGPGPGISSREISNPGRGIHSPEG